jgi:hypothetical protein
MKLYERKLSTAIEAVPITPRPHTVQRRFDLAKRLAYEAGRLCLCPTGRGIRDGPSGAGVAQKERLILGGELGEPLDTQPALLF